MGACCEGICGGQASGAPQRGPATRSLKGESRSSAVPFKRQASLTLDGCRILIPSNSGTEPKDKYIIERGAPIGHGAFGAVRKCTSRNGKTKLAMKTINKASIQNQASFQNEIEIQLMMDHPNVVKLFEVFEDRKSVYLMMEICQGGEMFDLIQERKRFREQEAAILMHQILHSVYYMHSKRIAHRDLKPENFLLQDKGEPLANNTLKLIDFGMSKRYEVGQVFKTKVGTAYYVAPEVMLGRYTEKADVWSCGIIMYILLSGQPPFSGDTDEEILRSVMKTDQLKFEGKRWAQISLDATTFIKNMCDRDVSRRYTTDQAFHDAWLTAKHAPAPLLSREQSEDVVTHLKRFCGMDRFRRAALHLIAHRLDDPAVQKLREAFIAMDLNGDGMLTLQEIQEGCERSGMRDGIQQLEEYFNQVDTDGSGCIDYTEFLAAMLDQYNDLQEEACWEAFRVFDRDGSGKISMAELSKILQDDGIRSKASEERVAELMKEADTDGDGEIDFDEFMAMMRTGGGA